MTPTDDEKAQTPEQRPSSPAPSSVPPSPPPLPHLDVDIFDVVTKSRTADKDRQAREVKVDSGLLLHTRHLFPVLCLPHLAVAERGDHNEVRPQARSAT